MLEANGIRTSVISSNPLPSSPFPRQQGGGPRPRGGGRRGGLRGVGGGSSPAFNLEEPPIIEEEEGLESWTDGDNDGNGADGDVGHELAGGAVGLDAEATAEQERSLAVEAEGEAAIGGDGAAALPVDVSVDAEAEVADKEKEGATLRHTVLIVSVDDVGKLRAEISALG